MTALAGLAVLAALALPELLAELAALAALEALVALAAIAALAALAALVALAALALPALPTPPVCLQRFRHRHCLCCPSPPPLRRPRSWHRFRCRHCLRRSVASAAPAACITFAAASGVASVAPPRSCCHILRYVRLCLRGSACIACACLCVEACMCPRALGCEVGRVRESPDGAAPVFNPSGGGSCLQPPSPIISGWVHWGAARGNGPWSPAGPRSELNMSKT